MLVLTKSGAEKPTCFKINEMTAFDFVKVIERNS